MYFSVNEYICYICVGLATSRSLGDTAVKGVGVIASPEVLHHTLTAEDKFMVCTIYVHCFA